MSRRQRHAADRLDLMVGYAESMAAAGLLSGYDREIGATELRALRKRFRIEDRRDLTGRILGDPLPGRSALDRRAPA